MRDFLDKACIDYYEGRPQLTDEEFDLLAEKHQYNKVGYQVTDAVPHTYRMYSLKKCFDLADAPLAIEECIETPKLDGAAVSLFVMLRVFSSWLLPEAMAYKVETSLIRCVY